ncbi:hypothetical protein D0Y65_011017 [Glycine soja]|uniref:UspA domain-containing protein n=1 Tax=Glycine soja TaxID=3848 RepID=A0A445KI08_GLYSO|nr:hypothetical protein D0Y65_011017 [Glycine soja]
MATPRVQACCASSSSASTTKLAETTGNKIMVVVDSSFEAKGALEWGALSLTLFRARTMLFLFMWPDPPGKVLVNVVMLEGAIVQEAKNKFNFYD